MRALLDHSKKAVSCVGRVPQCMTGVVLRIHAVRVIWCGVKTKGTACITYVTKKLGYFYGAPCVKLRNIKFCIIYLVNFG